MSWDKFALNLLATGGWRKIQVDRKKLVADAIIKADKAEAVHQLQRVVKRIMKQVRSNVASGLHDAIQPALQDVTKGLTEKLMRCVQGFFDDTRQETPILPMDCRKAEQSGGMTKFLIEQKPQVRTILATDSLLHQESCLSDDPGYKHAKRFRLSLPFTIFVIQFTGKQWGGLRVGFRNKPISSMSDAVCMTGFPNSDRELGVCTGNIYKGEDATARLSQMPYSEAVEQIVSDYWSSSWSWESVEAAGHVREQCPEVKSFTEWERLTKENPLMALKVKWPESCKVEDMIKSFGPDLGVIQASLQKTVQELCELIINESIQYMLDQGAKDMTYEKTEVVAAFAQGLREFGEKLAGGILDECESLIVKQHAEDLEKFRRFQDEQDWQKRKYDEPWVDQDAYRRWQNRVKSQDKYYG